MSETTQSTMGPKRLFILLALGAVVFYFLSSNGEVEDKEDEQIELTNSNDDDTQDKSNDIEINDISTVILDDKVITVSPSTVPQIDFEYVPQSNTRKEYVPNRNYDYSPQ